MLQKFLDWKSKLGKWFWVIILIIIVILWRIVGSANAVIKVESANVTQGDIVEAVSTSGTVKADRYVQLTFPAGGIIANVGVTQGQSVTKGQFIAQVDSTTLLAAYHQALNNYRKYQATVSSIYDQVQGHTGDETFAQKDTRTTAEVNRDNAYDSLLAAQDNLTNAAIYAPFSGVVDMVSPSSPGINVMPGAANYTVVDPSSVYFDAEVEETDLPNVQVGQKVNIKLDAYPSDLLNGQVSVIGIVAFTSSTGGNAYHIRISLPDNMSKKFKVGMQGDADIVFGTVTNVIKVSTSTIFSDGGKNYVWLVENGKIKKTEISVGASSDSDSEIKEGLTSGQTVVDNPASNLKDGERVGI